MELKQGTLLQGGKYKIEATLGGGSFGITYLATARFIAQGGLGAMEVETKVAIKEFFMHEVNVRDRDGRSVEGSSSSVFTNYRHRFRREAENLAKLRHPNIIRVYDVFDENGTTYYSMAYVEGTTLDEYIRLHHPLPEADAVAIFGRVCSALSSMHEQRMLHLDLKPKNIMRSTQGEVFLIDFGLSKQFGANGEPESSTTIGAGTPGYAPIEQANPIKDGTFPATLDIYSLGATMYKTLTGQRPPVATDVLNEGFPLEPLVQHRRSESLIKAIARCMSPMKKDRYQTVAELLRYCPALDEADEETEATIFDSDSHGQKTVVQHCPNAQCGKEIPAGARFCPYCGTDMTQSGRETANLLTFKAKNVFFNMIRVERGTFRMGDETYEWCSSAPAHRVTLTKDYYIGETPVTQGLWVAIMGDNPSEFNKNKSPYGKDWEHLPVENVSLNDCQRFICSLNKMTGLQFRLPTEAEWEFAARGGNASKGYKFAGSDKLEDVARHKPYSEDGTYPVAQLKPNELGLYDMSGNVEEWCSDYAGSYSPDAQIDPTGANTGNDRVMRGGSWETYDEEYYQVNTRNGIQGADYRSESVGLRLVLVDPKILAVTHCTNTRCGKEIPKDSRFCPYCGKAVAKSDKGNSTSVLTLEANGVSFKMVFVEHGSFMMGDPDDQLYKYDNQPSHDVTFSQDYYIGETPVTQGLWVDVMGDNPSEYNMERSSYGDEWELLPVDSLSWDDCQRFISHLNKITGRQFRLPTEAEWEFAARGGNASKGYEFAGSDNCCDVAWCNENSGDETHPVAQLQPNELGIYDMSGNVNEWCSDWYGSYSPSPETDPQGPITGTERVLRGGCYYSLGPRILYRDKDEPDFDFGPKGFRLVLSAWQE